MSASVRSSICAAKRHVRFTPNSDRESGLLQTTMSALPPKADMCGAIVHVRYGPIADICGALGCVLWTNSGHRGRRG